ncbi:MAG: sterol desaturase family protein [archaeon]|nr:sterol desaturase family protein [archaeon]
MIGIPIGLLYADAAEWLIHKHILHGLGRTKDSFWDFHWHNHHRNSRKSGGYDFCYENSVLAPGPQRTEVAGLVILAASHLPLLPIAPFFTGTVLYRTIDYYNKHKKAHLDPEWARENLPWHYDHHMGPDQDKNWGITSCLIDKLVGTRKVYVDTPKELERRKKDIKNYEAVSASEKVEIKKDEKGKLETLVESVIFPIRTMKKLRTKLQNYAYGSLSFIGADE